MNISPISAASCSRSSFGWDSLMDGLTMLILRQVSRRTGMFRFQNGFVDVMCDRRASSAAGTMLPLDHDHDGVFRAFIGRERREPDIIAEKMVGGILDLLLAGLATNLQAIHRH